MKPSRRGLIGASVAMAAPGAKADSSVQISRQHVDVHTFGATGAGTVDDTRALTAAAASGHALVFPPGRYRIQSNLRFEAPVALAYGAVLETAGEATIAFAGGLNAGVYQIFELAQGSEVSIDPRFTTDGRPEWWGARTNASDVDCRAAVQACLDACVRTLLQGADYYIGDTVKLRHHGHSLIGVAASQLDHPGCSRLMLTSASADGLQVGLDSAPPNAKRWLEHGRVCDLVIQRVPKIANPAAGFRNAPCGVRLQWAVTCYLERVETLEHSHGFFISGTVHCYLNYCQALRYVAGENKQNDFFYGFCMDNSVSTGFNSGNASLYISHCSTFSTQAVSFSESCGIRSFAGFTDTFITGFECALVEYGLRMSGRAAAGADYQTEDLIIAECVLDSPVKVGILIETAGPVTAAQIHNCYVAPAGPGTAIEVRDCHGAVSIVGCQIIAAPTSTTTGLKVTNSKGVSSMNTIFTDVSAPVVFERAVACRMLDTINDPQQKSTEPAVRLSNARQVYLAPIVTGLPGTRSAGVFLVGEGNFGIEVNCTGISASALSHADNKLISDGAPVRTPGPFGKGNLASGILG
jgi:hypothetical protein